MLIALVHEAGSVRDDFPKNAELAFFRIDGGAVKEKYFLHPVAESCAGLAQYLAQSQVDLLICGNLTEEMIGALDAQGVNLLRGIDGNADSVISSYLSGTLDFPVFE